MLVGKKWLRGYASCQDHPSSLKLVRKEVKYVSREKKWLRGYAATPHFWRCLLEWRGIQQFNKPIYRHGQLTGARAGLRGVVVRVRDQKKHTYNSAYNWCHFQCQPTETFSRTISDRSGLNQFQGRRESPFQNLFLIKAWYWYGIHLLETTDGN